MANLPTLSVGNVSGSLQETASYYDQSELWGTNLNPLLILAYFAGIVIQFVIRAPYDRQRRGAANTDQWVNATEQTMNCTYHNW